jgi:hypothetical protein
MYRERRLGVVSGLVAALRSPVRGDQRRHE